MQPRSPESNEHVHVVDAPAARRLVDYMKARLVAVPVTEIGDLITGGFVTIEIRGARVVGRTADVVTAGDRILVDGMALERLERSSRWNPRWKRSLEILHEDDDLIAVAKPAGMHVHPLGDRREHTLVNALVHHATTGGGWPWGCWRPHAVQRLDYVVSGVVVFAKHAEAKAVLVGEQKRGELSRDYTAVVCGLVAAESGIIAAPVGRDPVVRGRRAVVRTEDGGRSALTRWRVLERRADRTLVELSPETGRTHQLRVHLSSIGHPIVGDVLYGASMPDESSDASTRPEASPHDDRPAPPHAIALHACKVRLRHPRTREWLVIRRDAPADLGREVAAGSVAAPR